ncbi:MAG TPA: hypothetical protein VLL28_04195 [Hyphomicrobiaceae bacterium]|jgi:hypothetical protein|nr:hypothetical protein [Hyphomicrobiaceae bacterium]
MTKMVQLVEEMRARLTQIADSEQALVRALGEALSLVDQKLLHDVRNLTTEHEARRAAILYELQGLASRIGAFPTAQPEPVPGLDYADPAVVAIGAAHTGIAQTGITQTGMDQNGMAQTGVAHGGAMNGSPRPFSRGDWRQAASNIEDGLDVYFQDRAAQH